MNQCLNNVLCCYMLEATAKPNVNKMNLLDVAGHAGVWRAQGKSFVESVFLVPWLTPSLVAPFASEFLPKISLRRPLFQ